MLFKKLRASHLTFFETELKDIFYNPICKKLEKIHVLLKLSLHDQCLPKLRIPKLPKI